MQITRRTLLQAATVAAAAPALAGCSQRDDLPLPGNAPLGPFGKNATAEEVTAGLDLTGQTILVTGCNSGIGYETMRVLALRGAHVLGAARQPRESGSSSRQRIRNNHTGGYRTFRL